MHAILLTLVVAAAQPPEAAAGEAIGWTASGSGGAVAAGHADAVAAGIRLLKQGGNAADAAAATLFALAVTDYGMFAIGGEIPLLIYDAKGREVKSLSGVGRAPLDPQAIAWLDAHGIPSRGSMKAAPAPGAVDLCITLLRLYGTRSYAEAVAPTLELLDAHEKPWHADLAVTLRKLAEAEQRALGTREEKLVAARDRFYRGDVADELDAWYKQVGAFLRKRDLEAHRTLVEDPVSVDYRGYTIHKCGPWTQGPMLCQALRLLEGFDLRGMGRLSPDYIHAVTEALKLAFADRDAYYGDPEFVDVPLRALLSDEYTRIRRPLIDMQAASQTRRPGDPLKLQSLRASGGTGGVETNIPVRDTTTCVVADRWGNVVAATPSCNLLTNTPGPSGVTQGNRVRCLNTTPGHPNRLEPGKRPRVTLTPTLVTLHGKPVIAISVAGGDLQDQTTLNVLLNRIEFGMMPDAAVVAPRFSTDHQENSFDPNPDRQAAFVKAGSLQVSEAIPDEVRSELAKRGHKVTTTNRPIAHPVMILIDRDSGKIHAAGDPQARRHAAAID
ncbi:MAG: gamma-glutamyltransferase [Pirellulales bacterium]|nr:gamma-glutamyltransferase [Pirellulales bacterium]